jgi:hypothetical protein
MTDKSAENNLLSEAQKVLEQLFKLPRGVLDPDAAKVMTTALAQYGTDSSIQTLTSVLKVREKFDDKLTLDAARQALSGLEAARDKSLKKAQGSGEEKEDDA